MTQGVISSGSGGSAEEGTLPLGPRGQAEVSQGQVPTSCSSSGRPGEIFENTEPSPISAEPDVQGMERGNPCFKSCFCCLSDWRTPAIAREVPEQFNHVGEERVRGEREDHSPAWSAGAEAAGRLRRRLEGDPGRRKW